MQSKSGGAGGIQTVGYVGEQLPVVATTGCVFCRVGTDVGLGDGTFVGIGESMIAGFEGTLVGVGEGALVGLGEGVLIVILSSWLSSAAARPNTCSCIGACSSTVGAVSFTCLAVGFAVTPKVVNDAIVRKMKKRLSCFLETPDLILLNKAGLISPRTSSIGLKRKIINATLSIVTAFYHFNYFIIHKIRVYFGYMGGIKGIFRPECPKCKSRENTVIELRADHTYYCRKDKLEIEPTELEKKLVLPNL